MKRKRKENTKIIRKDREEKRDKVGKIGKRQSTGHSMQQTATATN